MKNIKFKYLALALLFPLVAGCGDNNSSESIIPSESDSISDVDSISEEGSETISEEESVSEEPSVIIEEGEVAALRLATVAAGAGAKESEISSGSYKYGADYGSGFNYTLGEFEFGSNNVFKYSYQYGTTGDPETHYFYKEDGEVKNYVVKYDGSVGKDYSISEDNLSGVPFNSNFFSPSYGTKYGGYQVAEVAFEAFVENNNGDAQISYRSDEGFTVSFGHIYDTGWGKNYYTVSAQVAFSESGALTKYISTFSQWYSADIVLDDELGTFSVREGATGTVNYFEYIACASTRAEVVLPYAESDFYFTSITVKAGDTTITNGSTVTVELNNGSAVLDLAAFAPDCASVTFDPFTFSATNSQGQAVDSWSMNFNSYSNQFSFFIDIETYDVTISTKNTSLSFTLIAAKPNVSSFEFKKVTISDYGTWTENISESDTVYTGKPVRLTASAYPVGSDTGYTMTCVDSNSQSVTLEQKSYDAWDGTVVYYEFTPTVAGVYTFTATSTSIVTVSSQFHLTVIEAPSVDDIFSGMYGIPSRGMGYNYIFTFTPDKGTDDIDGTLVVMNSTHDKSTTYLYCVDINGNCTCTYVEGATDLLINLSFSVNDNYGVNYSYNLPGEESDPWTGSLYVYEVELDPYAA